MPNFQQFVCVVSDAHSLEYAVGRAFAMPREMLGQETSESEMDDVVRRKEGRGHEIPSMLLSSDQQVQPLRKSVRKAIPLLYCGDRVIQFFEFFEG